MKRSYIPFALFVVLSSCGQQDDQSKETSPVEPQADLLLTAATDLYCPSPYVLDTTYRLCIDGDSAIGPFPSAMVQKCVDGGGGSPCGGSRWNAAFARRIRGTGVCAPGSTIDASRGVCVEGDFAYGPFPKTIYQTCLQNGGGENCNTLVWYKKYIAAQPTPAPVPTTAPTAAPTIVPTTVPTTLPTTLPTATPSADLSSYPNLVKALSGTPYVESSCQNTTYPGWPYAAKSCTYSGGGQQWQVTVANPTAQQTALWIIDAGERIAAVRSLKARSWNYYEQALVAIARQTMGQSSRIFPLNGKVWEDMAGDGVGVGYSFQNGVTVNGKYCRINSLTRQQWCRYSSEVLKKSDYNSCLTALQTFDAWSQQCVSNHKAAWNSTAHEGYRSKAYLIDLAVKQTYPNPDTVSLDALLSSVKANAGI